MTLCRTFKISILILLASSVSTAKAEKEFTCRGEISVGSLDSGVGDCVFITDSEVGKRIFSTCGSGDICEVNAVVDVKSNLIKRVTSSKRVSTDTVAVTNGAKTYCNLTVDGKTLMQDAPCLFWKDKRTGAITYASCSLRDRPNLQR